MIVIVLRLLVWLLAGVVFGLLTSKLKDDLLWWWYRRRARRRDHRWLENYQRQMAARKHGPSGGSPEVKQARATRNRLLAERRKAKAGKNGNVS